jgi:5-methyltetrahydrofolate--homocysteine methyltransferase
VVADPVEHTNMITPPFYGTGEMLTWKSESLLSTIDRQRLFRGYWRGGALGQEEFERTSMTEFEPAFELLHREILGKDLVAARGYYGFFPVITEGEVVVVLSPSDMHTELQTYRFPRGTDGRSIADYLRPEGDTLGVQAVTIGPGLSERARVYLSEEDHYSLGFFLNGIGNYLTELLANRLTREMSRALFLPDGMGERFSFGYPGMPTVEEQRSLFELIGVEERLGVTLTDHALMDPEHSTVGLYIAHPQAKRR